MSEETTKKAPAKKAAAPKTEAAAKKAAPAQATKAAAQKPAAKKSAETKKAVGGKTVTITQVGSPIGRQGYQRATLIGLGLNKLDRTRTLEDTPSVRGMIKKVAHLLAIAE